MNSICRNETLDPDNPVIGVLTTRGLVFNPIPSPTAPLHIPGTAQPPRSP